MSTMATCVCYTKAAASFKSRSLEEGLECPVCWESFDDRDNTPYVLWCGHSLCRSCVLSLEWATWCQFLTFRFKWKGQLRYPCKNFFLLWVVESLQGEHGPPTACSEDTEPLPLPIFGLAALISPRTPRPVELRQNPTSSRWRLSRWRRSGTRMATSFLQFTARIPLVLLFLFIVVYVLPFSTLVLALYCLITVLFAVPSFLVMYFSYPSLDWLVRAIAS
jgi:hypothetical protein